MKRDMKYSIITSDGLNYAVVFEGTGLPWEWYVVSSGHASKEAAQEWLDLDLASWASLENP